jgi:hypothetical protein
LPFAYSPYRLDIDAAAHLTTANEGIDFMKLTVKKNRTVCAIFFREGRRVDALAGRLRLFAAAKKSPSLGNDRADFYLALNACFRLCDFTRE